MQFQLRADEGIEIVVVEKCLRALGEAPLLFLRRARNIIATGRGGRASIRP